MRHNITILVFATVAVLTGCHGPSIAPAGYFPAGYFGRGKDPDDRESWHQFYVDWYGKHLAALREPALCGRTDAGQSYRFLWLRSFHHPYSFRIEVSEDGTACLSVKRTSGMGGYGPGRLAKSREIPLTASHVEHLRELLAAADLWQIPATLPQGGCDGSQWIVEIRDGGRYRLVDRWTPKDYPRFVKAKEYLALCQYFMELVRIIAPDEEYY